MRNDLWTGSPQLSVDGVLTRCCSEELLLLLCSSFDLSLSVGGSLKWGT